jgi:CRISPR system Cascade subunit CasE
LVQTSLPVDWSPLERRHPGYCEEIKANKAMPSKRFETGEVFHFRLHASPSRMAAGKRSALIDEGDQMAWMHRVAGENGFEIVDCDRRRGSLEKHRKADGNQVVLAAAEFDGLLRVGDAPAFEVAIQRGVGRGKAFGFGLLSLALVASG